MRKLSKRLDEVGRRKDSKRFDEVVRRKDSKRLDEVVRRKDHGQDIKSRTTSKENREE